LGALVTANGLPRSGVQGVLRLTIFDFDPNSSGWHFLIPLQASQIHGQVLQRSLGSISQFVSAESSDQSGQHLVRVKVKGDIGRRPT
jgi:hypothetical protein